jgi:dihydroorotate dehydrogenase (fumarate)
MDLTTNYLGLTIKNPLVPSASPLSKSVAIARELEDHGAAAIIMWSLFEEAVTAESESMVRFLHHQDIGFGEAESGFLPVHHDFEGALERYLDNIRKLKEALDIPVIASLNGVTPGGWIKHATELQHRPGPMRWSSTSTMSPAMSPKPGCRSRSVTSSSCASCAGMSRSRST